MERRLKACLVLLAGAGLLCSAGCGGGSAGTSPPPAIHNEWTWQSGLNTDNEAAGIYGTKGVASPNNLPGARSNAVTWVDATGDFWLFGGLGLDSTGNLNWLNDLWKYSNGQWTWIGGSNLVRQPGVYGTKGTPARNNFPGARVYAVSWVDTNGNFWFFGGNGVDSVGNAGQMNDLWEYSNGEWAWVSGSNIAASFLNGSAWQGTGIYGTKGIADPTNAPGARAWASGWLDSAGNLWLFGGEGSDSAGDLGPLNDLWKFSN